jgi:hypothetical protein
MWWWRGSRGIGMSDHRVEFGFELFDPGVNWNRVNDVKQRQGKVWLTVLDCLVVRDSRRLLAASLGISRYAHLEYVVRDSRRLLAAAREERV